MLKAPRLRNLSYFPSDLADACSRKGVAMQQVNEMPECSFCHAQELELFYTKGSGLVVQCTECGFTSTATNEHLASHSITLLAG